MTYSGLKSMIYAGLTKNDIKKGGDEDAYTWVAAAAGNSLRVDVQLEGVVGRQQKPRSANGPSLGNRNGAAEEPCSRGRVFAGVHARLRRPNPRTAVESHRDFLASLFNGIRHGPIEADPLRPDVFRF